MSGLDFIKTYLDNLLMMMPDTLDDHLHKLALVLDQLWANGLKVQAILDLESPTNLKELRRVLGIAQYYQDI
eukprot:7929078-Ditylum_brightwellii.AAC.1